MRRSILVVGAMVVAAAACSSAPAASHRAHGIAPGTTPPTAPGTSSTGARPDGDPVNRIVAGLSPRDAAAQLVITGFTGTSAQSPGARAASQAHVGGFILFKPNIASGPAVDAMNAALRCAEPIAPWIGVDQEPGSVARLAGILPSEPAPPAITAAYRAGSTSITDVQAMAASQGRGLSDLGFSMDFAPVVDVARAGAHSVISGRSFGPDPATVSALGAAYVRGLESGGVAAVAKHFPGLGAVRSDPHTGLPTIGVSLAQWQGTDRPPFAAAIAAGATGVMVTDVVMTALDPAENARQSRRVITDALRDDLDFSGIIVTDALEMGGPGARAHVADAAVRSVEAGADLVMVTDGTNVAAVIDDLVQAIRSGAIGKDQLDASLQRDLVAKERVLGPGALAPGRC